MNHILFAIRRLPRKSTIIPAVIVLLLGLGLAGCAMSPEPAPGAIGIGDPYYDKLGNGGYDVEHYTIALDVQPVANVISGTTTVVAQTTQALSALNLDFEGLTVDSVTVNGIAADYTREGRELTVVPTSPLPLKSEFTVAVVYHGSPEPIASIVTSHFLDRVGWFHTVDGTINVWSEPDGAATWFPVNDHPRDKATYRFEITVPEPFLVAANGLLRETVEDGGKVRYVWEMDKPMASYLAAINIGEYVLETAPGPEGVIVRSYFPLGFQERHTRNYAKIPEMIAFFSELFGPYPFAAYGVLIADADTPACDYMGALEIQTLSSHCPDYWSGNEAIVAHELAHQWFGDSVSLENWQDIWLKEGLATYAQWLWLTRGEGLDAVSEIADNEHHRFRVLDLSAPIGQPQPDDLYNYEVVYAGGALVFHALRLQVGDDAFFEILRTYADRYRYDNAGTDEFIAVAEEVSGQELQVFFDAWLYDVKLPGNE